ncbi:MAG: hypothetical protein KDD48_05990 [Bdellovibrionales bacterium]|nr:hypothetical protein [Bdellovibrionales bacterium]
MAKTILLIAGDSKDEQDLLHILKEINFTVVLEKDLDKAEKWASGHRPNLALLFERSISRQLEHLSSLSSILRQNRTSLIWIGTDTFIRSCSAISDQDQRVVWPSSLENIIDAVEKRIGLPQPPPEQTQKINEHDANEILIKQQSKAQIERHHLVELEKKLLDMEKHYTELKKRYHKVQEELVVIKKDLEKEKNVTREVRHFIHKAWEVLRV